jgi:hypothetical protein
MALPTQIDERLTAPGWRASAVEGHFVRGAASGGQKIKMFKSIFPG